MLSIDGGLGFLDVDAVSFTKTLDRVLGQIIREAARRWLRAVLASVPERDGFPVLTGAAKSTLVPLGRFLKNVGNLNVTPQPDSKGRFRGDRRALGEASQQFTLSSKGFEYNFEWSTDLLHYFYNEQYPIATVESSPWHSLEAGEEAYLAFVNEAIARRLPNLVDYIEIRRPNG